MNLPELKTFIANGEKKPLYIFTGDEIAVMDVYINKLKKLFNGNVMFADSLQSIVHRLKSNSLINSDDALYIIREDKAVLSADKIWQAIKSGGMQRHNSLLFIYTSIDKRGKFYKEFSNYITV